MRTISWYIARTYLVYFVGIFFAVMAIFLVTDFVDRAKAYTGPNWVIDVAILYAWKAVVVAQQLAPAALLLAAGATVSVIRKRGELTAIDALSFGPRAIYFPIGAGAALIALMMIPFDEYAVVKAGPQVDEITTKRFNRWGDWRFYFQPKQWFRLDDRIFYLRNGSLEDGYSDVTILRLSEDFELRQRIDAQRMEHVAQTRWKLMGVVDRTFATGDASKLVTAVEAVYDLGAPGDAFRIRKGRPEQMHMQDLVDQIDARADVGLPTQQFILAAHNRFAYPLAGFPAAMLAIGLALRRGRHGHLTTAVLEGLAVAMSMWGLMVVCRTLVLADRMSPGVAAWTPFVMLLAAAAFVFWFSDLRHRKAKA